MPMPAIRVVRCYVPDRRRQVAALLVLLARRGVESAGETDTPDAPTPEEGEG